MLTVQACQQHRLAVMPPNKAKSFPAATVPAIAKLGHRRRGKRGTRSEERRNARRAHASKQKCRRWRSRGAVVVPYPTRRKNEGKNLGRKHPDMELSEKRRVFARKKRRGKRAERKSARKKHKAARARSRLEELTFGTFNVRTAAVNGVNGVESRGTRDNAVRLCHVEPARVPLRHVAPSPPQVLGSLHRLAKAQSHRPPDFLSGYASQDGKSEHRGDFTQGADLVARFVARMEDTRLPKCAMFGEMVGGAGCVGSQEKEWMGCFLDDLRAFGINADHWTTAAQDEGEWRRTAERGAEHFMAKWIVAEKTKAGLRHAVVCPNVTGRTKKRIAQSKRARAGSLTLVD